MNELAIIDDGKGRVMEVTEQQAKDLKDAGIIFFCTHHCMLYHVDADKTWLDVEKYLKIV